MPGAATERGAAGQGLPPPTLPSQGPIHTTASRPWVPTQEEWKFRGGHKAAQRAGAALLRGLKEPQVLNLEERAAGRPQCGLQYLREDHKVEGNQLFT